jgi:hypothetical protein
MPNHYVGDLLHTMGISGLSRVRTELVQLAIVQPLTPSLTMSAMSSTMYVHYSLHS